MQIEIWNILLNAVVAVSLVVYGLWFRSVVRHQLASKNSTIESLGAAIKANEAEITRLRSEASPAIADSYKRVKDLADGLAAEANDLTSRLKAIETDQPNVPLQLLMNRVEGFSAASAIFGNRIEELSRIPRPTGTVSVQELLGALIRISQDMTARTYELVASLREARGK